MRKIALYILCAVMATSVLGQDSASVAVVHPTLSMFTIDAGYASIHDSYLTPITYEGMDLSLAYEATRMTRFAPDKWLWQLNTGIDYNYVENPSKNNQLHKLMGDFSFNMQRQWSGVFSPKLNLSVGPMTQLRAGIVYNAVNSNNPVTMRAHWNVGAAAQASFHTRLGRKPVTLRYQAQVPVLGVFFAPEYDESYYEIYLGNHHNLVHMAWWGNRIDMTNYLGADFHLGSTILRIGYRGRLEHWNVNGLHVHDISHSLVIGIGAFIQTIKTTTEKQ